MATVDIETGQGVMEKLVALAPRGDAEELAYVALMGLGVPAAVLVSVGALGAGPDGAGLAAGVVLFVATALAFELGWYVGAGGE